MFRREQVQAPGFYSRSLWSAVLDIYDIFGCSMGDVYRFALVHRKPYSRDLESQKSALGTWRNDRRETMGKISCRQRQFLERIKSGWLVEVGNTNPTAISLEKKGFIATSPGVGLTILCRITDSGKKTIQESGE